MTALHAWFYDIPSKWIPLCCFCFASTIIFMQPAWERCLSWVKKLPIKAARLQGVVGPKRPIDRIDARQFTQYSLVGFYRKIFLSYYYDLKVNWDSKHMDTILFRIIELGVGANDWETNCWHEHRYSEQTQLLSFYEYSNTHDPQNCVCFEIIKLLVS